MIAVMDAGALIAYFKDEPGAEVTESVLVDNQSTCYVHALNMCEVYYDLAREHGDLPDRQKLEILMQLGLQVRDDMDPEFWMQAGHYKAEIRRISLADCFCLTLANRIGAEIVTADHHEFDRIAEQGLAKVRFIR